MRGGRRLLNERLDGIKGLRVQFAQPAGETAEARRLVLYVSYAMAVLAHANHEVQIVSIARASTTRPGTVVQPRAMPRLHAEATERAAQ